MQAIYARVSTEDQARTGYSLGDQIATCRQKLLSMGLTNIEEYVDDGYSGEFLDRPALSKLRDDLRAKLIQNVMVYDPDRLSRKLTNQLIIAEEIEKFGAKLLFITADYNANPEGRLFFSMRGAIAEFEKEKIRERSLRGKRAKVTSGKPLFARDPFGYTCDRAEQQYIINEDEAKTIRLIFQLYIENQYGIPSLAEDLRERGIVNRKGKPFDYSVIHSILSNEMYAGTKWTFQTYQKTVAQKKRKVLQRDPSEWVAISVPAIIDRETWEKSVQVRKLNRTTAKRNTKAEYLLKNFIRCPDCEYAMGGVRYPKRTAKDYIYYVCTAYHNGHHCDNRKCVPSQELDQAVWDWIISEFKKGGPKRKKRDPERLKEQASTENKLKKLKGRQAAILKWVAEGTIDMGMAEKDLHSLNKEISLLQIASSKIQTIQPKIDVKLEDLLAAQTFEEKRMQIKRLNPIVKAKRNNGGDIEWSISFPFL